MSNVSHMTFGHSQQYFSLLASVKIFFNSLKSCKTYRKMYKNVLGIKICHFSVQPMLKTFFTYISNYAGDACCVHYCLILTKIGICQNILVKLFSIKFYKNVLSGSQVVSYGQINIQTWQS